MKLTQSMKIVTAAALAMALCACTPPPGDQINAKIEAMPTDQRVALIKSQKMLSTDQKIIAINNLQIPEDQKKKYIEEVRAEAAGGADADRGGPPPQ